MKTLLTCSAALRTVAVEATILGWTVRPSQFPAAKFVDGGLVKTDHRAQRTADEMEFVLDDQVRRSDRRDVLDRRARQTFINTVIAGAIGTRPKKSMPRAIGVGSSE